MSEPRTDLGRITLSVLFIGGLIVGSLWVLYPFLAAFIWAVTIVVATWPVMLRVQGFLWGKRALAVLVMCLGLLAILIIPLSVAAEAIVSHVDEGADLLKGLAKRQLSPAPVWLGALPLIGERVADAWNRLAAAGMADLLARLEPYGTAVASWFARQAGGLAVLMLQFFLIVILSAVLYSGGESWGAWVRRFGHRLAAAQGDRMVVLAGQAIRGVALGVVVTALVQSALGGLGLVIAGVPFAGMLTVVMFALCIAQLGPILVLLGATAWVFMNFGTGWGTFMLAWSIVVGTMDNFLRPVLIRRGANLPLLLIFTGVVGGLVAFGIIGIFVGPVVLAVAYTLLDNWVGTGAAATSDPVPSPGQSAQPTPAKLP